MVQPRDGKLLGEQALRRYRIPRHRNPGQLTQRLQVPKAGIAGDAHDRGCKIVTRAVHTIQESRLLELADRHIESHCGKPRLQHLLEWCLAAAHGQNLETGPGSVAALEQAAGGIGCERQRLLADVIRQAWWYRTRGDRGKPEQISVDNLLAIDGE